MNTQRPLLAWVLIAAGVLSVLTAVTALAFPTPSIPWLSRKGIGDNTEAGEYYATIGAPATFADWKAAYGFDGVNEVRAIYYNFGDLGFGRDMHCRNSGADIACYVVNHGFGPGGPPDLSVEDAIAGQNELAAVAMVFKSAIDGSPNDVSFYIYGPPPAGTRLNSVALDSEGEKFLPQLCLPCHGGTYNPANTSNSVTGASFLPFDAPSLKYSTNPTYTLAAQQEAFRKLNSLVRDTNPTTLTVELIDGWYAPGGVTNPGSTLDDNFVASGYAANDATRGLYNDVVKPYCRTCHIAQVFNLGSPADFNTGFGLFTRSSVFTLYRMPHAEMTAHNFWTSLAPVLLANDRAFSLRVTTLDDPAPDGCNSGVDCSLREAVMLANATAGQDIITFDLDGTFTLDRGAGDDTASMGDLDITQSLTLLGNGADRTTISGVGRDRMFHLLGGPQADVVIQGVTIQGGVAGVGHGAGILNDRSRLTLNDSVVRDNFAIGNSSVGSGIANLNGAVTFLNRSIEFGKPRSRANHIRRSPRIAPQPHPPHHAHQHEPNVRDR